MFTTKAQLINDISTAAKLNNYRALQRALKAYRKAGYAVSVKLNSKKAVLKLEASTIILNWQREQYDSQANSSYDYDAWYEALRREQAEQQRRQAEEYARKQAEQAEAQKKADAAAKEYDKYFATITSEWVNLKVSGKSYKAIYRELSRKYHPDLGGSTAAMQALNNIAEVYQQYATV